MKGYLFYSSSAARVGRGLTGRNTKRKLSKLVEVDVDYNDYEEAILKSLKEENGGLARYFGDARLYFSASLNSAAKQMCCKECVIDYGEKESLRYDKGLEKYLEKHASTSESRFFIEYSMATSFSEIDQQQEPSKKLFKTLTLHTTKKQLA